MNSVSSSEVVTPLVTYSKLENGILLDIYKEGKTIAKIAKDLGVSRKTVYMWLHKLEDRKLIEHVGRRWVLTERGKLHVERSVIVSEIADLTLFEKVFKLVEKEMCRVEGSNLPVEIEKSVIDYMFTVLVLKTIQKVTEAVDFTAGGSGQEKKKLLPNDMLNLINSYWSDELSKIAIHAAASYYCSSDEAVKEFQELFHWLKQSAKVDFKILYDYITNSHEQVSKDG